MTGDIRWGINLFEAVGHFLLYHLLEDANIFSLQNLTFINFWVR